MLGVVQSLPKRGYAVVQLAHIEGRDQWSDLGERPGADGEQAEVEQAAWLDPPCTPLHQHPARQPVAAHEDGNASSDEGTGYVGAALHPPSPSPPTEPLQV